MPSTPPSDTSSPDLPASSPATSDPATPAERSPHHGHHHRHDHDHAPGSGHAGGPQGHRHQAPRAIQAAVLTVSDTRTVETDTSGQLLRSLLEGAGHTVLAHAIVADELRKIQDVITQHAAEGKVQALLITGGTGITLRDVTLEAVQATVEKELPGFGELFRFLSFQEIGPAAMLSRATAGVRNGMIVVAMPGSTGAVRLAMEKLLLSELGHMVWEANRQR